MTRHLRMFRFRRNLISAVFALVVILALAGLTGLAPVDMSSLFDNPELPALAVAQN